jgi:periplasmic protein TonB
MAKTQVRPLIYRPPPPWYFWTAFGAAIGIHLTAVALAQKREAVAVELPPQPPQVVEATLAPPEATPPPEDIPLPEPPPPPEIKPEFVEERTPPPRPPPSAQKPKFTPIKAAAMSMSQAKALAVYNPRPPYPYEARAHKIMGSGVITVDVDPASGNVTDANVTQSIGNSILDDAAVSTFRRWRFRPGSVSKVRIPITFTMTGASY